MIFDISSFCSELFFFENEAVEATEVIEAVEVIEAAEVPDGMEITQ